MNLSALFVLAIGFGSPSMLIGLGAATIPIIIHLLSKRRYQETSWAAMKFLVEAARKQSRRLRWEQLVILLIRCLVVMFLAIAFSRPFFDSAFSSVTGRDPRHIIVVLDNSFSMGQRVGNQTRLEQGKDTIRQLVNQSVSGDGYSLLCLTRAFPSDLTAPTYRQDSFLAELDSIPPTELVVDLNDSMMRLASLLRNSPEPRNKDVLIVSDFQQRDWEPSGAMRETLVSRISRIAGENVRITFLDVGGGQSGNLAVEDVTVSPQPILVDQPATIQVSVRSFEGEPFDEVNLELQIDDRTIATKSLASQSGNTAELSFPYTWQNEGPHRITARIIGDRLEADNQRYHVARVRQGLRVLLIEGEPAGTERERSSHYLRTALETVIHPVSRQPLFSITTTDSIGFTDVATQPFDVIALCDLPAINSAQISRLQSHLSAGGGLLLIHGSQTDTELWSHQLDQLTKNDWPIQLEEPSNGGSEEESIWGFLTTELTHPVVKPFAGNPGTGLDSAVVWERIPWSIRSENQTRPVLMFDDGTPALVEVLLPQGRCLQMATACDAGSGSWAPLSGSFPPIAIEMFQYLAVNENLSSRILVGEALTGFIPADQFVPEVSIITPDGERTTEQPFETADGNELRIWRSEDILQSGFYTIEAGVTTLPSQVLAVNVDPREGNLTRVSKKKIRETLFTNPDLSLQIAPTIRSGELSDFRESPISRWLLWIGLALLAVEVTMVWQFRAGLLTLLMVLIAGGVVTLASWTGPAPAVAGGVLITCLLGLLILKRALKARQRKLHRSQLRW